jgi:two-component SAPR family response regulator
VLSAQPDVEVVAEAGDGAAALDVLRSTEVDVVLMDIRMPRMEGIKKTTSREPATMALTSDDDRFTFGLVSDVIDLLERHSFQRPTEEHDRNLATGRTLGSLLDLVRVFEGRQDSLGRPVTETDATTF